ncbi:hypothetical protein Hanom_Chr07g00667581 [Helianthus anomalus]
MYKKKFLSRLINSVLIRKIGKRTDKQKRMLITIFFLLIVRCGLICVCGKEASLLIYSVERDP